MAEWVKNYVAVMRDRREKQEERDRKYRMDADGQVKRYMKESGFVLDVPIEDAEFEEVRPKCAICDSVEYVDATEYQEEKILMCVHCRTSLNLMPIKEMMLRNKIQSERW